MLYRKTKGGRRDKALNNCFLALNVANRTEHHKSRQVWGALAKNGLLPLMPFLVSKVQSRDPGKKRCLGCVGGDGPKSKNYQDMKEGEG